MSENEDDYNSQSKPLWEVRQHLLDWRKAGAIHFHGTSYEQLRRLFGVQVLIDLPVGSFDGLNSVHGLTIYKMLVARIEA